MPLSRSVAPVHGGTARDGQSNGDENKDRVRKHDRLPSLIGFEILVALRKSLNCVVEGWMVIEREELTFLVYSR